MYCYTELRVRLACVKHAASVRSEPGSNSRLKLVHPISPRWHRDIPVLGGRYRGELLNRSVLKSIRRLLQTDGQTKRVLACIIRLSKSRYSQASWKETTDKR